MKVGDKVYCKKTNESNTKGKLYDILIIDDDNRITLSTDKRKHKILLEQRQFFIYEQVDHWEKFSDFFITLKELRKKKLEKINNDRNKRHLL
jgi:hypothetical protein